MKNILIPQKGVHLMPFVKVLRHGQVTVPIEYREQLGIQEGDILEVEINRNGVVFKPKTLIDKTIVEKKETLKEKEWSALATTSFAKDWENEEDAIYDNWKKHYHI